MTPAASHASPIAPSHPIDQQLSSERGTKMRTSNQAITWPNHTWGYDTNMDTKTAHVVEWRWGVRSKDWQRQTLCGTWTAGYRQIREADYIDLGIKACQKCFSSKRSEPLDECPLTDRAMMFAHRDEPFGDWLIMGYQGCTMSQAQYEGWLHALRRSQENNIREHGLDGPPALTGWAADPRDEETRAKRDLFVGFLARLAA